MTSVGIPADIRYVYICNIVGNVYIEDYIYMDEPVYDVLCES